MVKYLICWNLIVNSLRCLGHTGWYLIYWFWTCWLNIIWIRSILRIKLLLRWPHIWRYKLILIYYMLSMHFWVGLIIKRVLIYITWICWSLIVVVRLISLVGHIINRSYRCIMLILVIIRWSLLLILSLLLSFHFCSNII